LNILHILQAVITGSAIVAAYDKSPATVAVFVAAASLYAFLAFLERKRADDLAAVRSEIQSVKDRLEQMTFTTSLGR
jgi:hypothetical protein